MTGGAEEAKQAESRRYRQRPELGLDVPGVEERAPVHNLGPIEPPPSNSTQVLLEMGPSHPAMNGTFKMDLLLEGERVRRVDIDPGYLHRGFEKSCENVTWTMVFPYTDRLNYASPFINNNCYAAAVEKLFDIEIPERAKYCRTITAELSRMADHLSCLAFIGTQLGAQAASQYLIEGRELIWDAAEEVSGARLTVTYARVGGVSVDFPPAFKEHTLKRLDRIATLLDDVESMLSKNANFLNRMVGVGVQSRANAISWGWTGPCLRSTGVAYDVRRAAPYDVYDRVSFDVPVGENGDNYDRYSVRLEELRQSRRIVEQCLEQIEDSAPDLVVSDTRLKLPAKETLGVSIEAMMNHFKLIIDGIQVPSGEAYAYQEGANGELGFYIVSLGSGKPWKIRVRPPCFPIASSLTQLLPSGYLADIAPTFGSLNVIAGECDR